MAENKILGYKRIFGFVLPDWVDESIIRMTVTFLLSSTVMLFVLIFVVWPKFATIADLSKTYDSGIKSLTALKDSKKGLERLNEITIVEQEAVLRAIPTLYSPEEAIFLLRKLSSEVEGVSIVTYKLPSGVLMGGTPAAPTKDQKLPQEAVSFVDYPIKLTVTAPVDSLFEFVNKIEKSLPFGTVSDLGVQELSKLSNSSSDKTVQMELEVKYFQAKINPKINIAKVQPLTDKDVSLMNQLTGYESMVSTAPGVAGEPVNSQRSADSLFGI